MIIYCLTSPSDKRYIGQTTLSFKQRLGIHKYDSKKYSNRAICRAIKKYGLENFQKYILIECPEEEADFWESFYIKLFNTYGENGYNLDTGGHKYRHFKRNPEATAKMARTNTGRRNTPEAIQNMREAALKRPKPSEATKQKMSLSRKGRTVWNKGKSGYHKTKRSDRIANQTAQLN